LFRIIQECLTNAHKHAKASRILMTVAVSGEAIQIGITDNGVGFPEEFREGFGIHGMRERTKELGGTLGVESRINTGTSIIVRIPLQQ
jgi:two-component system sensor histidine kinase DegS